MEAAARFAEILERILPKCVDECRKIKLHPNNRSILHDLKVVEQEIGDLDDESKLLYAERLAQIEKACMLVADNQVILARMETQGYFQKWSKEHRDLLKQTKGESLRAKHLAKVTSQDAKTHKALQTAQTKNAIDTLGETATKQGIDPRDLVHSVQNHAKAERIAINNMTNNFNITINPEPKKPRPLPSRKPKVHVVSSRPIFPGPVRRKKVSKEVGDLASVLIHAMEAPAIPR